MAKLTAEEERALKRLMEKREAPDSGPVGRSVNVSIDLGDPKQVERAQRLGLLDLFEDEEPEVDTEADEADDTPKRKGYFGAA